MGNPKRHIFVCTNQRPPATKPSCGAQGSIAVYTKLMEELDKRNLYEDVMITPAGCLSPCSSGPILVVYPEGVWYSNVKKLEDIEEIAEKHMQNGEVVERLVYKFPEY